MKSIRRYLELVTLVTCRGERRSPELTMNHISRLILVTLSLISLCAAGNCLAFDQSICTSGAVTYHPNGKLKSCTLKDDLAIGAVRCKQYAPVEFFPTGSLLSCTASDFYNYESITCNQYGRVSFYPTGKLSSCDISKQIQIDGKKCAQFEPIYLFENGKLKSCSTPQ
jgi:hypothetical protein